MNFKHMLGTIALAAAAAALPLSASAQAYLGAGLGTSDAREFCRDVTDCDKSGTTWRAFAGWRFSRHFAAELAYVDLGRFTQNVGGTRTRVEGDGPEATLLGIYQVDQVSIFGRIGGYYANTKAALETPTGSTATKEKNSGLTYGLGLQYDFTGGLGARLEWQHYAKVGDSNTTGSALDINTFTLSLLYRFR